MAEKKQVIKKAVALFMEKGCKAVTMDEIASDCGISKRTLYELFEDKSDLLAHCLVAFHEQCIERMHEMRKTSENTAILIINIVGKPEDDRKFAEYHKTLLRDVRKFYPKVFDKVASEINREIFEEMVSVLEDGQQTGYILTDVVDVRSMALFVLEVMIASHNRIFFENKMADWHINYSDELLFFMRGLCTKKGTDIIDRYLNNRK